MYTEFSLSSIAHKGRQLKPTHATKTKFSHTKPSENICTEIVHRKQQIDLNVLVKRLHRGKKQRNPNIGKHIQQNVDKGKD